MYPKSKAIHKMLEKMIDLFSKEKARVTHTRAEIEKTDKEIDQLVYQLYKLMPQEIAIVEKNLTHAQCDYIFCASLWLTRLKS